MIGKLDESTNNQMNKSTKFRTFEDLECWQGVGNCESLQPKFARNFPKRKNIVLKIRFCDRLGVRPQILPRATGDSIIRKTSNTVAMPGGSAYEVLDHFITGVDENLIPENILSQCRILVEKSVKLLNGYIRYLESRKGRR